jgi:hypothetical protein
MGSHWCYNMNLWDHMVAGLIEAFDFMVPKPVSVWACVPPFL